MSKKWLSSQLVGKEEEIQRLNTGVIGPIEELKEMNDKFNKCIEDLEETKEVITILSIQIEEARRTEEALKGLLIEREYSFHKLEQEVVDLRRKVEKSNLHVKFNNSSAILDEILDSQRPPNDKSSLRYKQKDEIPEADIWTPS